MKNFWKTALSRAAASTFETFCFLFADDEIDTQQSHATVDIAVQGTGWVGTG